jgi:hypothetical protein
MFFPSEKLQAKVSTPPITGAELVQKAASANNIIARFFFKFFL